MARIRTIKPEFWTDEKVVELSSFARLLFIGIWNFCDDEGRMVYSPRRLKMQILPADDVDCSALIGEIRRNSLVHVYAVDSIEYLQVCGFAKHQKIDRRQRSKLPAPPNPPDFPRIPPTDQGSRIKERIKDQGKDQGENLKSVGDKSTRFTPPTLEQVADYCRERKNKVDPQRFVNYYTSNGWMVGKTKMKNWQAAVRTWERDDIPHKTQRGKTLLERNQESAEAWLGGMP